MRNSYIILTLLLSAAFPKLQAQELTTGLGNDSTYHSMLHRVGVDLSSAYVCPTHSFFKGNNQQHARINHHFSAHLKYGFKFAPDTYFGQIYPHATQGIGIAYNTFFNQQELGNPWAVYVFQHSRLFTLHRHLSLDYEWNFGASFGWKEYDEERNPKNDIVGSRVNAYMNVGLMLDWHFAPQWDLTGGLSLTHYSNGNTRYPNFGVNTIGARLGLIRTFGDEAAYERTQKRLAKVAFQPYFSYDLVLYGAIRKKGVIFPELDKRAVVPGKFGIAGLNFNPMYNVNPFFRVGLSLDIQYDESANIRDHVENQEADAADLKFYRPDLKEQLSAGLSVRGEIVMPIFSINMGLGKNFICQGADTDKLYQILALKAHISKRAFLHIGYQLYRFKDPNNLMVGIGYRFKGK